MTRKVFLVLLALVLTLSVGLVACGGTGEQEEEEEEEEQQEIQTWYDLDAIRTNLSDTYLLEKDLDSSTPGYEELAGPAANGGKGWQPIGSLDYDTEELVDPFSGSFDGQGYEIRNLFINRPYEHGVGLFGAVDERGIIENVGVVDLDVTGGMLTSGLIGVNQLGTVSNSYATGSVTGNDYSVGGLVGVNAGGTVRNSYALGSVTGSDTVGGLVGYNAGGTVRNSCAKASVIGELWVGGLVGENAEGEITNCYASGMVMGASGVGGLAGCNKFEGTISISYSTGRVNGVYDAGGLVGDNYEEGIVVGSFWDTETSGQAASNGGTDKTTAEMQDIATFSDTGWDIIEVAYGETHDAYSWNIVPRETYPFLSWEEPVEVTEIRTWHDLHAIGDNLAGHYVLANDLDSASAGYEELASATANTGKGWEPIGSVEFDLWTLEFELLDVFGGTLDGQGYEIRDLFIDRPDEDGVGLFSVVGGSVENVGVVNVDVTGATGVGGLVGANAGTIRSSYSTGSVSGGTGVGGLAGANGLGGTLSNSYSDASVTGEIGVGGLVGGNLYEGIVSSSYSTGSVEGDEDVGGLVGSNHDSTVSDSYSTGSVIGASYVGGLVGENDWGTVSDSFWDIETSGQATSAGGTGKTTAQMKHITTFSGAAWDITAVASGVTDPAYIWNIIDDDIYPFLSWQSTA